MVAVTFSSIFLYSSSFLRIYSAKLELSVMSGWNGLASVGTRWRSKDGSWSKSFLALLSAALWPPFFYLFFEKLLLLPNYE
jgi:hypothetical protein